MGDTIERCINSLLENTAENVEILIVDDGSTDNTSLICENLSEKINRLNYIKLERDQKRKLGETRNISVNSAKSEVVVLHVDADDIWLKGLQDIIDYYLYMRYKLNIKKYLIGNHLAITTKEIFWKSKGYSNLYRGEDRDLMYRLALNKDVYFIDHSIIHKRLRRAKNKTRIKSFKDLWSQSKYDVLYAEDFNAILLSSLFFSPGNKTYTFTVRLLRFFFIPICSVIFLKKRKKGIISWKEFMNYRSQNRGNALELIDKSKSNLSIQKKRDYAYEKSLLKYPFEVKIRPEGFSINL
jgi:glycosyltransferase involved in cell wall biosynthesis